MRCSVLRLPFLIALAVVGLPAVSTSLEGCSSAQDADSGSAEFIATTSQELSVGDVSRVTLTISGPGVGAAIVTNLVKVGAQWQGTVGAIPVGANRTFHADAFDATNTRVYSGEVTTVTITKGVTAIVSLLLQQSTPPSRFQNSAPRIDSLVASSNAVTPGEALSLAATAHDPDPGDTLTYAWTASCGTFSAANALASTWTAPATEGPCRLMLRATDTKSAVAAITLDVDVHVANGRGSAGVTTSLNTWPEVALITATPARIDVGEITALAVTATDADGDVRAYEWTATCAGTFDDSHAVSPHFTLSALPAASACALVVTVTDGRGGSNTGTIDIGTGPAVPAGLAPVIDQTFQSSTATNGAEAVTLSVRAHDPEGGAITVTWTSDAGNLGAPTTTAGTSGVTWTSPQCGVQRVTIAATVTDSAGQSTIVPFLVDTGGAVLAAGLSQPQSLTRFGSTLWVSTAGDSAIHSVSTAGGPVTVRATGEAVTNLVAGGAAIYWTSRFGVGVKRLDHLSSSPAVVHSGANAFAIARNDTTLFWSEAATLFGMPLGGGAISVVGTTTGWTQDLAADANNVYATDFVGRTARQIPLAAGAPTVLSTGRTGSIATGGGRVVFFDYDAPAVRSWPIGGGPTGDWTGGGYSDPIEADDLNVYFAGSSLGGAIFRAPLVGGAPAVVGCGLGAIGEMQVDATSVYFTQPETGKVLRLAK